MIKCAKGRYSVHSISMKIRTPERVKYVDVFKEFLSNKDWASNALEHVLRQEVLWKENKRPEVTGSLLLYGCSPEILCKCIVWKISREGDKKWKILGFLSLFSRRFYAMNCEQMEVKIKILRRGFFVEKTHLEDNEEFPEKTQPFGRFAGFSGHVFSSCGQLGEPVWFLFVPLSI